ncbi:MAG: BON domain-containing protein [Nitrosomonas sp. PRO4]|nr:BON domain-containing protein [Nitrosomonas sp. PRO4]
MINFIYSPFRPAVLILIVLISFTVSGCAGSPTQASTGQFIDDSAITTKIKTKLLDDPVVSGLAISVETFKGTVQLSGFAKSKEEIAQAEKIARGVEGVKAVRNNILLKN